MFCSNCGKEVNPTDKFCFSCGFSISKKEESSIEVPVVITEEVQEKIEVENNNYDFTEYAELIKNAKASKTIRREIITLLVEKGFTEKQSDYMIQHYENGVDFKRLELSDLESANYTKFVKTDFIDKYSNVKRNLYTHEDLAEERFKASTMAIYVISVISLVIGIIMASMESKIGTINGSEVLVSSLLSLVFAFSFQKLRMPLFMFFLSLVMFGDRIITQIIVGKLHGTALIVMFFLVVAAIQSYRSRIYIVSIDKKILKYIVTGVFLLYVFFASFGIYLMFTEDNWDNKEMSKVKSNVYESVHTALVNNKGSDSEELKQISRNTAECTLSAIKKEYQTYSNLEEQMMKNSLLVKAKVDFIRKNCLDKYNK